MDPLPTDPGFSGAREGILSTLDQHSVDVCLRHVLEQVASGHLSSDRAQEVLQDVILAVDVAAPALLNAWFTDPLLGDA